jgi:hypothetical protein
MIRGRLLLGLVPVRLIEIISLGKEARRRSSRAADDFKPLALFLCFSPEEISEKACSGGNRARGICGSGL